MIKKAGISDVESVAKLAVKMWKDSSVRELTKDFKDVVAKEDGVVYIHIMEETVIGFAQCALRYDYVEGTQSSPVGYLEGIFIDEPFRRKGYAKELLQKCESWAKEHGCTEFASDCEMNNIESLDFHLSCGFAEANRIICFSKKVLST